MSREIAESRQEAILEGKKYYNGKPCKHDGTTIRRTKQADCLECHNRRNREYNQTPQARLSRKVHKRLYKVRLREAMPPWADKPVMAYIYKEARMLGMDVDHIIPLKHPLVCGLHVETNLQLLSPEENNKKRNQFDPWTFQA